VQAPRESISLLWSFAPAHENMHGVSPTITLCRDLPVVSESSPSSEALLLTAGQGNWHPRNATNYGLREKPLVRPPGSSGMGNSQKSSSNSPEPSLISPARSSRIRRSCSRISRAASVSWRIPNSSRSLAAMTSRPPSTCLRYRSNCNSIEAPTVGCPTLSLRRNLNKRFIRSYFRNK
jgi:hypothetical protein